VNKYIVSRESILFANAIRRETGIIAGVDDSTEHRYRFPRLGKIHLGTKTRSQAGREYPTATDYFVLTEQLLKDKQFMDAIAAINADPSRPRKLPIQLVSHDIIDNIRSSLDYYGANHGLKCRSWDGIVAQRVNEETGEIEDCQCLNIKCEHYLQGKCQVVTRLRFFLPDAIGIGVWQLDTRSSNNRINLPCEMGTLKAVTGGILAGLDLLLTLEAEPKIVTVNDKQIKRDVWLLHIRSGMTLRELRQMARNVSINWSPSDIEDVDTSYDDVVMENAPESEIADFGELESDLATVDARADILQRIHNLRKIAVKTDTIWMAMINAIDKQRDITEWPIEQLQKLLDQLELRAAQNKYALD